MDYEDCIVQECEDSWDICDIVILKILLTLANLMLVDLTSRSKQR